MDVNNVNEAEIREVRTLLETLVRIESPSSDPAAVTLALGVLADALEDAGAELEVDFPPDRKVVPPPTLVARVPGANPSAPPLLVVGHLDTVHRVGTLIGPLPLREEGRRLFGPGVYDMKAGLAVLVGALNRLRARGERPARTLRILVTPDEEIGAPSSRGLLEEEARQAFGALVLEPPMPGGHAKIRRKGVGQFRITLTGVPAHSGIEPERGASAIHALGTFLPRLLALAAPERGTTLNVGTVRGGTAVNVVAEEVHLVVDVRISTSEEAERIESEVAALGSPAPRVAFRVEGGIGRPPLEPTPRSRELLAVAAEVAALHGRPGFDGGATGGGSDGNFLAAAGCPVLDGLGVNGDGAHTHEEHIQLEDLGWRIGFLADLLARVGSES
ncbi:MAG: M20 family peptidase [Gemmatimonadales bacterium]|nr:MAG: M20 family peptidase [Gemmatimonadales bacterium]